MSFAHLSFFFDCAWHKEKRYKKETPLGISPTAEVAIMFRYAQLQNLLLKYLGRRPLTLPPFEKGGRKLSCGVRANIATKQAPICRWERFSFALFP